MTEQFATPLPPAVRAAAERANALMQQANAPATPEVTPPAPDATTPPPANDPTPPAQQTPEATPPAPPPVPEAPPPAQQPENWEHRYNSMRGRYEAAERTIQAQNENLRQMEDRLRALESQRAATPPENDILASLDLEPVSKEMADDFGPEVISLIERKTAETMRPIVERQQREIERLRAEQENASRTQSQSAYQRMLDHLDTELPEWRQLNNNQDFIRWLSFADPLSGQIRQAMIQNQWNKNSGPSVLAFFTSFLKETGQAPQTPQTTQPEKIPLESLAAPGRPQPAAPAASPADKPIFSRAYVKEFYDRKARGEFAGREAEANKVEEAIFAAQKEGRVQ